MVSVDDLILRLRHRPYSLVDFERDTNRAAEALTTLQSRVIELEELLRSVEKWMPKQGKMHGNLHSRVLQALSNTANSGGIAK